MIFKRIRKSRHKLKYLQGMDLPTNWCYYIDDKLVTRVDWLKAKEVQSGIKRYDEKLRSIIK